MGEVVGPTVGGEEEGGDGRMVRVVFGCDPVFEEVEGAERAEEEGDAPEGVRGGDEDDCCEGRGEAEGYAEEECAQGDAGEGFGPVGVVAAVEGRGRGWWGGRSAADLAGVPGIGVTGGGGEFGAGGGLCWAGYRPGYVGVSWG